MLLVASIVKVEREEASLVVDFEDWREIDAANGCKGRIIVSFHGILIFLRISERERTDIRLTELFFSRDI